MADRTTIEWTDATWNPIVGCSVKSPGCTNCYAMRLAGTRLKHHPSRAGLTVDSKAGPVWTGETRFDERALTQPLRWRRPRKIFVCAHSDLFHEATPDEWIDRVFAVMALCPQHTFQVLTKRPERMREYITSRTKELKSDCWDDFVAARLSRALVVASRNAGHVFPGNAPLLLLDNTENWRRYPEAVARTPGWPLRHVWLGVTAEDQTRADERIPVLLETPAAVRFVSVEPMIGAVDLTRLDMLTALGLERDGMTPEHHFDALRGRSNIHPIHGAEPEWGRLNWVICGGESGPGARPMHPDWVRSLRDQCAAAGAPFLFKQWGEFEENATGHPITGRPVRPGSGYYDTVRFGDGMCMNRVGKARAGRLLDGVEHNAFPEQPR